MGGPFLTFLNEQYTKKRALFQEMGLLPLVTIKCVAKMERHRKLIVGVEAWEQTFSWTYRDRWDVQLFLGWVLEWVSLWWKVWLIYSSNLPILNKYIQFKSGNRKKVASWPHILTTNASNLFKTLTILARLSIYWTIEITQSGPCNPNQTRQDKCFK